MSLGREEVQLIRGIASVLGAIAALSGLVVLVTLSQSLRLRTQGEIAEGEVVGLREDSETTEVYPRVRFAAHGAYYQIEGRTPIQASKRPIGQRVRVYYMPDEPGGGRIDELWELYRLPVAFGIVLGIFAVPSLLLALWASGWF